MSNKIISKVVELAKCLGLDKSYIKSLREGFAYLGEGVASQVDRKVSEFQEIYGITIYAVLKSINCGVGEYNFLFVSNNENYWDMNFSKKQKGNEVTVFTTDESFQNVLIRKVVVKSKNGELIVHE